MTGSEHTGSEQFTQALRKYLASIDRRAGRHRPAERERFLALAAEQARMWVDAALATAAGQFADERRQADAVADALRGELATAEAERDDYAKRLKATAASWAELAADRDRIQQRFDDLKAETQRRDRAHDQVRDELRRMYDRRGEAIDRLRDEFATAQQYITALRDSLELAEAQVAECKREHANRIAELEVMLGAFDAAPGVGGPEMPTPAPVPPATSPAPLPKRRNAPARGAGRAETAQEAPAHTPAAKDGTGDPGAAQ